MGKMNAQSAKTRGAAADPGKRLVPVVCIGLSAGGLDPVRTLFKELRADTGMAFVVIHHVRNIPTLLPEILTRDTQMPVKLAREAMEIEANRVYVLPSGQELAMTDGLFSSQIRSKIYGYSNVFTLFLRSLAQSKHRGIAVVLSGVDADGAAALKEFQKSGGITIAQSPGSSERPDMPQAAIDTECVDYVAEPGKIAELLQKLSRE
jgi:two-component system chemotaxis response regulator CheB